MKPGSVSAGAVKLFPRYRLYASRIKFLGAAYDFLVIDPMMDLIQSPE